MDDDTAVGSSKQDRYVPTERQREFASKYGLLGAAELLVENPIDWLVEDYLPAQSLCELAGPSKSYKTFLALDWALTLACERGRPVLYVAAEGGRRLGARVRAWLAKHQCDPPDSFWLVPHSVNLLDGGQVAKLCTYLPKIADVWDLVVIDTMARSMAGDENSTEDMSRFVAAVDQIRQVAGNPTALIVHHFGWFHNRQRGNSAFYAACDTVLYLKDARKSRDSNEEDEIESAVGKKVVRLTVDKQKDAEEAPDLFFTVEPVEDVDSVVIVPAVEPEVGFVKEPFRCPVCDMLVLPRRRDQKTCGSDRCRRVQSRKSDEE